MKKLLLFLLICLSFFAAYADVENKDDKSAVNRIDTALADIISYCEMEQFVNKLMWEFEKTGEKEEFFNEILSLIEEQKNEIDLTDSVKCFINGFDPENIENNPEYISGLLIKNPEVSEIIEEYLYLNKFDINKELFNNLHLFLDDINRHRNNNIREDRLIIEKYFLEFLDKQWKRAHKDYENTENIKNYSKKKDFLLKLFYLYEKWYKNFFKTENRESVQKFDEGLKAVNKKDFRKAKQNFEDCKNNDFIFFVSRGGFSWIGYCEQELKDFINSSDSYRYSMIKEGFEYTKNSLNLLIFLINTEFSADEKKLLYVTDILKDIKNSKFTKEKENDIQIAHLKLAEVYKKIASLKKEFSGKEKYILLSGKEYRNYREADYTRDEEDPDGYYDVYWKEAKGYIELLEDSWDYDSPQGVDTYLGMSLQTVEGAFVNYGSYTTTVKHDRIFYHLVEYIFNNRFYKWQYKILNPKYKYVVEKYFSNP
ncbi:MAG: hypothetical protein WC337_12105 [Candidatus Muiribacteriota bacterium]